jgi:hypothetical protein
MRKPAELLLYIEDHLDQMEHSPRSWSSSPASFVEQAITLLETSRYLRGENHLEVLEVARVRSPLIPWAEADFSWEDAKKLVAKLRERTGPPLIEKLALVSSEE